MLAKVVIPFRDGGRKVGQSKVIAAGEVIRVKEAGAAFLFATGYAVPADDEAVQWCKARNYAQTTNPTPAGS